MKYLLLCYHDEATWQCAGETAHKDAMNDAVRLTRDLQANGQYLRAAPLQPVATATSVRIRDRKRVLTDGPFAETREVLGGFYLIDVPNWMSPSKLRRERRGPRSGRSRSVRF